MSTPARPVGRHAHRTNWRRPTRVDWRLFTTDARVLALAAIAGARTLGTRTTYSARALFVAAMCSSIGTALFVIAGLLLFRRL